MRRRLWRETCQHPAEQRKIHFGATSSMWWHRSPLHPISCAIERHVRSCPCCEPASACAISCSSVSRMSRGEPRAIRWREKLSTLARLSHIPARARLWSYLIVHDRCVSPCHSISHAASSQRWCKLQTAEAGGQTNSRWTCTGTLDMPLALLNVTLLAASRSHARTLAAR